MLRLSVLDQSTVVTGRSPDTSIRESLALAKHCEALGYSRYWCAEHHNSASQAGTAPEILISAIAATTTRIRVGSAGVMLPHYSSLKVAEQFRVLDAIAPGRIDLGLGRAPGSDGRTAFALNPNAETAADHFPAQVRDLLAWLAGERLIEGHPVRDIIAQPGGPTVPEVWMLGSSDYTAPRSPCLFRHPILLRPLHHRRPRCGAGDDPVPPNISPERTPPDALRGALRLGFGGLDTEAEATRLFGSREMWRLERDRRCLQRPALTRGSRRIRALRSRTPQHRAPALTRRPAAHQWSSVTSCARWPHSMAWMKK